MSKNQKLIDELLKLKCRGWSLLQIAELLDEEFTTIKNTYSNFIRKTGKTYKDLPEFKRTMDLIEIGWVKKQSYDFVAQLHGLSPKFVRVVYARLNKKFNVEEKKPKTSNACKICGNDKGANRYYCDACHSRLSSSYYFDAW